MGAYDVKIVAGKSRVEMSVDPAGKVISEKNLSGAKKATGKKPAARRDSSRRRAEAPPMWRNDAGHSLGRSAFQVLGNLFQVGESALGPAVGLEADHADVGPEARTLCVRSVAAAAIAAQQRAIGVVIARGQAERAAVTQAWRAEVAW
jgi:hypothetical protein